MSVARVLGTTGLSALLGAGVVLGMPQAALAAPAAPGGVSVARAAADAATARVAWKPVAGTDHYSVEFFDGVTNTVSVVSAGTVALGLPAGDPCATYRARVGARDQIEGGSTSGLVTLKPLAPGVVRQLAATRIGDRATVRLSWLAPTWVGYQEPVAYRVQVLHQPDNAVLADRVVDTTSLDVPAVDRLGRYTVVVSAQNRFGACQAAKASVGSDRVAAPTALVATRDAATPALVTLRWQAPTGSALLGGFEVGSGIGKISTWLPVDAGTTTATLSLDPAKTWMLRVRAVNDLGPGTTMSNTVLLAPAGVAAAPAASTVAGKDTTGPAISTVLAPKANAKGWANRPVTATFTCTDPGVGVAACPQPLTLADDGAGQMVAATATDRAGNTTTRTGTVNVDTTPPVITAHVSPEPTEAGWNRGPVVVTFTCADAVSDIAVCPAPVPVSGQDAKQVTVSGTATDLAANTATATVTVRIDTDLPTITATSAATDGWATGPVTVTFTCDDPQSGVAGCPQPIVVAEGVAQQVTGTVVDWAGNSATTTLTVSRDATAPTVTSTVTPAPNAAGWYRSPVTVAYACTDALSGVATCPEPVTVDADGAAQPVTATATDHAGNRATATASINLDTTAPTIGATVTTPTPGAYITVGAGASPYAAWFREPVTIHYTCADTGSGIAACPTDRVVSLEGADQQVTATASDYAGNSATATTMVSVDRTAPVITVTRTAPTATGWNTTPVTLTYRCADTGAGIVSCPQPTTVSGDGADQPVTATAVDHAGNSATATTTVSIDRIVPTITASVAGTRETTGWYRGPVTIHYTCTDTLSGIAACPTDRQVTDDGADQQVTATVADRAGNTAAVTTTVSIDRTPPTTTTTILGTRSVSGWYRGPVRLHYTCADTGSGISTCPTDQPVSDTTALTATTTDRAGNTTTSATSGLHVDTTAPRATITGLVPGASYPLDKAPAAGCQTTDSDSGVATPAALTLTRDTAGHYTVTCVGATDQAANTTPSVTATYTVTATGSGLAALISLYQATTPSPAGNLGDLIAQAKHPSCQFLTHLDQEMASKTPALTSTQAAELRYWATQLTPAC